MAVWRGMLVQNFSFRKILCAGEFCKSICTKPSRLPRITTTRQKADENRKFCLIFCLFLAIFSIFGWIFWVFGVRKTGFFEKIAKKGRKWRVPLTKICISVSRSVSENFGYVLRKSGARKMHKNGQKTPNFASILDPEFPN